MHISLVTIFQIGSRSSVYSPESRVRKTGSFIYEDFMPTDGMYKFLTPYKNHFVFLFLLPIFF